MKILVLVLLLFLPKATALPSWVPSKCTNVLEFVEVLVSTEHRNVLIGKWRVFLNNNLRSNQITRLQYEARKIEILEANRIINNLEAKGHKGSEIIGLASFYCSI